jgi:hypothetical protein
MNVEIGAETALFPEKEYISGIFVAVHTHVSIFYIFLLSLLIFVFLYLCIFFIYNIGVAGPADLSSSILGPAPDLPSCSASTALGPCQIRNKKIRNIS